MGNHDEDHIEEYGDQYITSKDAKVPRWLIWIFVILPFLGGIYLYAYWNGSAGWLDRGNWHELQIAAITTFPSINQNDPKE